MSESADNIYELDPRIYDEYIDTKLEKKNFDEVFKKVREQFSHKSQLKILDLCCGTGIFPRKWLINLTGISYVGVDINKSFIEFAKNQLKGKNNFKFIVDDATNVDLREQFDIVIATSSYHHIKDEEKRRYLNNINTHLKEEGVLIIYEKLVSKFKEPIGAVDSASKLYAERIKYMLQTEKLTEKQLFALFNELYLSAIRKEEYKVSYEYLKEDLESTGFQITEEVKLWPKEDLFDDPKMGDFVIVAEKK